MSARRRRLVRMSFARESRWWLHAERKTMETEDGFNRDGREGERRTPGGRPSSKSEATTVEGAPARWAGNPSRRRQAPSVKHGRSHAPMTMTTTVGWSVRAVQARPSSSRVPSAICDNAPDSPDSLLPASTNDGAVTRRWTRMARPNAQRSSSVLVSWLLLPSSRSRNRTTVANTSTLKGYHTLWMMQTHPGE